MQSPEELRLQAAGAGIAGSPALCSDAVAVEPQPPLRIGLLNPVPFYGGGEKRIVQAAIEFRKRGHLPVGFAHPRGEAYRRMEAMGVGVVPFHLGKRLSPRRVLALARALRQSRLDVAVCYTERSLQHAAMATHLLPAHGPGRRPALVYYHSGAGVFQQGALNRWLVAPRVSRFVANARATLQELHEFGWLRPAQLTSIYDGVDAGPIDAADPSGVREALGCAPDDLVVLVAARLISIKGHDLLLESVARLAPEHPRLKVWFAGDGPERTPLAAQVARLGLDERVRLLGFREDVPRLLRAADILCHPSRREGAPNAVLEGMVAGLPVAAAAAYGTAELVAHGETGFLSPVDDEPALRASLDRLLRDEDLRGTMGRAGRARALEEFSEDKSAERWLALLNEVVNELGGVGTRTA